MRIRVLSPTEFLGLHVRKAVSKAWRVPCSLLVVPQLSSLQGTLHAMDALQLLSQLHPATPALFLVMASVTFWDGSVLGFCREGRALVALARLGSGAQLVRRACSVAVHEAGHLLGLGHCRHRCVMSPAGSVGELDRRPLRPCDRCRGLARESRAASPK
ncbi:MAG: hypothetical protein QXP81_09075 [Nitrososphaerota archaeon]